MKIDAKWLGKRAFEAIGPSGYTLKMDATELYGGDNSGNTPTEMLLVSLAGCIGIDVTMILKPHLDTITKLEIHTDGKRNEELPKEFTDIELVFEIEGNIDGKKLWRAINLGKEKYCAVSNSLSANITYRLILNGKESISG
ncbi:OsmC family peroxiredoxin [Terrilactibacillus sp. BCM23-1]|uniref:OsmC family peroxiredoxin n=1 Tax=Terrilactibacillus tamarindi TaxID=2599694 RepID=A0A6N8CQP2_9BACI|nr:OsmC family protein [Terrilactibacillus tamarindi]MTT31403.1 OsmC family peroxiredoxin [Terrilactibacillus tamarindi]